MSKSFYIDKPPRRTHSDLSTKVSSPSPTSTPQPESTMNAPKEGTVGKGKQPRRSSTRQKDGRTSKVIDQSSDVEAEGGSSINGETVDASEKGEEEEGNVPPAKKRKTTKDSNEKPSTLWCHHERRAYDPYVRVMISCQTTPQEGATKRCVQSFCRNCLEKFYGTDVDAMLANGEDSSWVCPVCRDCCECSACRKKKGLELLGRRRSTTPAVTPVVAPKLKGVTIGKVALRPLISGEKAAPSESTSILPKPSFVPSNFTVPLLPSPPPATTTDSAPSAPKKQRPLSRAPPPPKRPVPPAPFTLSLSSVHYPHPELPCTNSILSRLNLREFFLRFHRIMPALDLSYFNSSSSSASDAASNSSSPKPARRRTSRGNPVVDEDPSIKARAELNAKTLASLSNDIFGLRLDAKGDESLIILEALVDLLRSEKKGTGVFKEEQYEVFAEIYASIKGIPGNLGSEQVAGDEEKVQEPWGLARKLIGEESEWLKFAKEWSRKVDAIDSEGMDTEGTDQMEGSEAKENGDAKENGTESTVTGDERLAISCALIDMAYDTDVIRQELIKGVDYTKGDLIDLNKEKFALRNELARQQKELSQEKQYKPDGTGVRAKAKIDQWKAETKKIDKKLETLETENGEQATRVQHSIYLKTSFSRLRFDSAGTDALSNEYYLMSPAPSELLDSHTDYASSSAFPIDEDYKDPNVDYPIIYSILVHGTNPSKLKEKSTKSRRGESNKTDEVPAFLQDQGDDWFVVRDPDEIEQLAEWIECTTKQVEYEARLLAYTFENPTSSASRFAKGGQPTKEVVERAKERMETLDTKDLVEKIRQFKDFVTFEREK